jgi:hypothetical protein
MPRWLAPQLQVSEFGVSNICAQSWASLICKKRGSSVSILEFQPFMHIIEVYMVGRISEIVHGQLERGVSGQIRLIIHSLEDALQVVEHLHRIVDGIQRA